jgi:hypothetical protein
MPTDRDIRPLLSLDSTSGTAGTTRGAGARTTADASAPRSGRRDPTARKGARHSSRLTYTGTAVAINRRFESRRRLPTEQVATFRLERYDARGDRRPPISVEMRGLTITGGISDGERVRVSGRMRGGVLAAHEVYSLTTGGTMSTRVLSLMEHRLGRRGALAVVAVTLVLAAVAVRFIPQIYYNTPFGKGEYRADVTGTCERVTAIKQQPPPPPSRMGVGLSDNPTDGLMYDRTTFLTFLRGRQDTIAEEYQILLARTTPVALMSRRDQVRRLLPQQAALFRTQDQEIESLPALVSLTQLEKTSLRTQPEQEQLDARLAAAMTALAGRTCSV